MDNNASDRAKDFIKAAKDLLGSKIQGISVYDITDEPYKMFSLKFTAYKYFVVVMNYDRGHFGCCISYGADAIGLDTNKQWDDNGDLTDFWKEIDLQLQLRIPDKFLTANGWK